LPINSWIIFSNRDDSPSETCHPVHQEVKREATHAAEAGAGPVEEPIGGRVVAPDIDIMKLDDQSFPRSSSAAFWG
jgi:hypothetical protein